MKAVILISMAKIIWGGDRITEANQPHCDFFAPRQQSANFTLRHHRRNGLYRYSAATFHNPQINNTTCNKAHKKNPRYISLESNLIEEKAQNLGIVAFLFFKKYSAMVEKSKQQHLITSLLHIHTRNCCCVSIYTQNSYWSISIHTI